jgi:hypothetical protein
MFESLSTTQQVLLVGFVVGVVVLGAALWQVLPIVCPAYPVW